MRFEQSITGIRYTFQTCKRLRGDHVKYAQSTLIELTIHAGGDLQYRTGRL